MFNFSWSEIALIVAVALIAIGPKDLPTALKAVAQMMKKARGMAGEFQGHMNELLREADLEDVRKQIDEIRNFDFKGTIEKAIDPDQSISKTFSEDPFATTDAGTVQSAGVGGSPETAGDTAVLDRPLSETAPEPVASTDSEAAPSAPSFVPPAIARAVMQPPAFVPPEILSTRS